MIKQNFYKLVAFTLLQKENDRDGAVRLVGEKTFGKGIIQNLQQLREGGVAVTVARYETPLHHNINKVKLRKQKTNKHFLGTHNLFLRLESTLTSR